MADADFMATARKRFEWASDEERDLRVKFIEDLPYASSDGELQWDPMVKRQREAVGRPAMSFPRCHTFVQQVANEARDKKPQVKFAPRRDIDKDTAEIYEGLARFIQYESDAQIAYDTAIEYSAGASFGYYRFLTQYCDEGDDESDDQNLKIVPVYDPLTVYGVLVPACFGKRPRWAFVCETIPKEEFEALYPDAETVSIGWDAVSRVATGWIREDTVQIAEYWYVEETPVKGKRKPKRTVKFCKINGYEVLPGTETEWAGSTIPIVPVLGRQLIMDGKPQLYSVVRPQKAAQQLINYSKSRIAETLSTSPISPFMVAEGQIAGYEDQWASLNTVPRATLTYKIVDAAGRPIPPPARNTFEPPIAALSAFVAQEVDDMKATTGIFDASLGAQGNETSGQAIMRRQQQSNLSTMHFMDNLERSFRQAGEIIEELIPKIYDTAREVEILGADESSRNVLINEAHTDESGKERHYKIADARIKLIVTVGKAYGSRRQESFNAVSQVLQTSPNLFPMVGDILFRNSDMAGADELAERFHKMLPPALQNDENNPLPPEAQAAVAQAQQQVQAMQGELAKMTMERQAKVLEHQGKMQQIAEQHQADMELENRKMETQIAVAEIEAKSQLTQERAQFVEDLWKQFHSDAHDLAKQAHGHAHERQMQADKAQQQAEIAEAQASQPGMQQPAMQPKQVSQ